jgi:hypothetical protein
MAQMPLLIMAKSGQADTQSRKNSQFAFAEIHRSLTQV